MHILILKDPKVRSLDTYFEKLEQWGITYQIAIAPTFMWKDKTRDHAWLSAYLKELYRNRAEGIDMVQFFLSDWQGERGVVGTHFGKTYSGYQVCIVRDKRGKERTALHELMHTLDNIVWLYSGIRLAKIVGVEDWDEDIVHGTKAPRRMDDYDEVFDVVRPYVEYAIGKRKKLAAARLVEKLKVLNRQHMNTPQPEDIEESRADKLYETALTFIGTDASPSDIAPDELGCAETVSNIIKRVLPHFPIVTGSWSLWDVLRKHQDFTEVTTPEPGDIIISPTGTGIGIFPGHVGIYGEDGKIMSNSSLKPTLGQFVQNYTTVTWHDRYVKWGGFKAHIYRLTK